MAESSVPSEAVLTSLPRLDELRLGETTASLWERPDGSNLDVFVGSLDSESDSAGIIPEGPLAVCHLETVNHFDNAGESAYEDAAAIALAAHHLNTGDGSVVPQVEGLHESCPIRFTVSFFESREEKGRAFNFAADLTDATGNNNNNVDARNVDENGLIFSPLEGFGMRRKPCAFIGEYFSPITMSMGILTGLRGYPQISPSSTSSELDDKEQFPLFSRTIPSDEATAIPLALFFYNTLGIRNLAVVHINDPYGNSFADAIQDAVEYEEDGDAGGLGLEDFDVFVAGFTPGDPTSVANAIQAVADTQFQYFFVVAYERDHDEVMLEAYKQGIAGTGDHNWFFADSFNGVLSRRRSFEPGSPLQLAYEGTGIIEASPGIPGVNPSYDRFLDAIGVLGNPSDLAYMESILPPPTTGGSPFDGFRDNEGFLKRIASIHASHAYEATIGLGLAACAIAAEKSSIPRLTGREHYNRLIQSVFDGPSGRVAFDEHTGSREPVSTTYIVTNFVSRNDTDSSAVFFEEVLTHTFWSGSWSETRPFVFNDGTTVIQPSIPPPVVEEGIISMAVRGTILAFCGLILVLALACMRWTEQHKRTRIVLSSQPFFLHIICFGIILLASAIIPISLDHGVLDLEGSTIACHSIIWLVTLGFSFTVSAFCAKTRRVNTILNNPNKFQRIKVSIRDVAKPMVIMMAINVVLLALMSALTPPAYEIVVERVDRFDRPIELRGDCGAEPVPFLILIAIVNLVSFGFTIYEAWRARNLSTEFSETKYILRALIAILGVAFIGVPLLFLADEDVNALAFVRGALVFLPCLFILVLIFLPKMSFIRRKANMPEKSSRWRISGLEPGTSGSASHSRRVASGKRMSIRWNLHRPEQPVVESPRNASERTNGEIVSGHSEDYTGVKITSTKSRSELVQEVEELSQAMEELRHLINTSEDIQSLRRELSAEVDETEDSLRRELSGGVDETEESGESKDGSHPPQEQAKSFPTGSLAVPEGEGAGLPPMTMIAGEHSDKVPAEIDL